MSLQKSPQVIVQTYDTPKPELIKNIVNTLYCGFFTKGKSFDYEFVYNIEDFIFKFGEPIKQNIHDWYMIYNYFQYTDNPIIINRVIGENSRNASCSFPKCNDDNILIKNDNDFFEQEESLINEDEIIKVIARNPGEWGNKISVAIFTQNEIDKNEEIFPGIYAKSISKFILPGRYVVIVFDGFNAVEKFIIKYNEVEKINRSSKYIFIKERFLDYKYFDGNIFWICGDEIIADGELENNIRPVFYGNSLLRLGNGYTEIPNKSLIYNEYVNFDEFTEIQLDFIISNENSIQGAIDLNEKLYDCITFIQIPKGIDPIQYKLKFNESSRLFFNYNYKRMYDTYTGKNLSISCIGDLIGMRTQLMIDYGPGNSHCKRSYSLKNLIRIDDIQKTENIEKLFMYNINVVNSNNSISYFNSENMSDGSKLTNRLILIKIERICKEIASNYLFELNDVFSRNNLKKEIEYELQKAHDNNEIKDFKVICDDSNNKITDDKITCDVFYKPTYLTEVIKVRLYSN